MDKTRLKELLGTYLDRLARVTAGDNTSESCNRVHYARVALEKEYLGQDACVLFRGRGYHLYRDGWGDLKIVEVGELIDLGD